MQLNLTDGTLDGGTSTFLGHFTPVDKQKEGFQETHLKQEEPEDDDYLCKATKESLVWS